MYIYTYVYVYNLKNSFQFNSRFTWLKHKQRRISDNFNPNFTIKLNVPDQNKNRTLYRHNSQTRPKRRIAVYEFVYFGDSFYVTGYLL